MVLIPGHLNPSLTLNSLPSAKGNTLFNVGQILTANIQPIKSDQVKLTIGNQSFIANTKQPITENGTVQIKVKQTSPEIQLSIIKNEIPAGKGQANQAIIQAAYRQFMPSQAPLSQTFQQINLLQSLPPALQTPIQGLLNQIGKQDTSLDGKALKERFLNSGLFLESKLKSATETGDKPNLKNDVKAQLLQLQQQVNQSLSTTPSSALSKLSQLLNQALSRITVQQIQLYENPNITPLLLPMDKHPKVEEDHIEIHKRQNDNETSWEVYIDLSLPDGQFSSKLKLTESNQLSCYIWCETETLKNTIEQKVEHLKALLQRQDFERLNIQMIPYRPTRDQQAVTVALIDIKV